MDVQKLETLPPPPGVFGSLRAGFDVVSSHVALILLPLALDVFLWLGPRLSVEGLLSPFFKFMFEQARRGVDVSELNQFVASQTLITEVLKDFNLFSLLSKLQTFPIGISSLAAQTLPVTTPLGAQNVVQVSSLPVLFGLSLALVLIGWAGGGLYYRWVSGTALGEEEAGISFVRVIVQTFFLSILWMVGLIVVSLPILFVLFVLMLIHPLLFSGAVFLMLLLSFWFIVPLFFTPHGIFARKQNALYSVFTSLRMARFTLPTSGMFVLSVFLLSRGLNYLWSIPLNDSWLTLVGIAGHAFITTALLAASFVYYRDMNNWLQNVYEKIQQASKPSSVKQV